ncbi:hypothetical protein Taro_048438 [Colocasia esculenta]|uniref:Rubredoxin-like domain-containing protein n=1 Tax=Colocasia esculenta TaxID=4460 RepID=A0A843X595_COLES|nr:hypothetical protein [Colocasia esculenta]
MAAFATARPTLSFHLHPPSPPLTKPGRTHLPFHLPGTRAPHRRRPLVRQFTPLLSVEVSKEDKSLSEQEQDPPATLTQTEETGSTPEAAAATAAVEGEDAEMDKFEKRRLSERFAVLNTGIYECRSCGYRYDETVGDASYPIPPGLGFEKLPEDWRCPTCGAAKSFFDSKSMEIAGFAQNQQFGLGGNSLTSGQKATLIYGTLLFFFVLFLSGYFLQ